MVEKRPALGRGLGALIPEPPIHASPAGRPIEVDLDLLRPNPLQPRQAFDDARLEDLAGSIRSNGIIQPIVVRQRGATFEIIAGERRWRAAQRAGLLKVPVLIRDVPDDKLLEVALIENIQRESLNPIDEALAYRRLAEEFGFTQDRIAQAVGKDRTSIANYLRLLGLPVEVQLEVARGRVSMGHARAILGLEQDAARLAATTTVINRGLSVRETEALVRRLAKSADRVTSGRPAPVPDVHTRRAEDRLRLALGTRVRIVRKGAGGHIEIDFVSEDELQRLFERLAG